MERVAYLKKGEGIYYLYYYVDHENDTVPVGLFCADRITVERKTDNDTSEYVTLHVGDNKMEFIADRIKGMEYLNEGDVA